MQMSGQDQIAMLGNLWGRLGGIGCPGPTTRAAGRQDGVMAGEDACLCPGRIKPAEDAIQPPAPDPAQGPVRLPLRAACRAQAFHLHVRRRIPVLDNWSQDLAVAVPRAGKPLADRADRHVVIARRAHDRGGQACEQAGSRVEFAPPAGLGKVTRSNDKIRIDRVARCCECVDQNRIFGAEVKVCNVNQSGHWSQSTMVSGRDARRMRTWAGRKTGSPSIMAGRGLRE